jgi:hypothetical protein
MNQASRAFWLVPVLPAAGQPNAALRAVPERTVSAIIAFIIATMSGLSTRGTAPGLCS